jgi:hypothetical protein
MCDHARQIAEAMERVCNITLSRGLALRSSERAEIEQALAQARLVLAGVPERDPVAELLAECERSGFQIFPGDLVKREAAAALCGMTVGALDNRRCYGLAPDFVRQGRRVHYRLQDLVEFIRVHRQAGNTRAG